MTKDTIQRTRDELLAERAELPNQRLEALQSGDQAEYFRVERRLVLIDDEIAAAEIAELRDDLETAWEKAEELYPEHERCVQAHKEAAARDSKANDDLARGRYDKSTLAGLRAAQHALTKARDEEGEASRASRDATLAAQVALVEVEDLEQRLQALTGEPTTDGDGLRALPPIVRARVSATGPDGETVWLTPGERCPRWAAFTVGPHVFAEPVSWHDQQRAELRQAQAAQSTDDPDAEAERVARSQAVERRAQAAQHRRRSPIIEQAQKR